MKPIPVIAIFDVGKTNKKLFLFDEDYRIVFERTARFNEIEDEDGFPCENIESIKRSVSESLNKIIRLEKFELKAVNFTAYGASLVYLDAFGQVIAPLYNYLKPYPEELKKQFYDAYGNEDTFSFRTASPALGNLNSGLQLYRIKFQNPGLFKRIKYALHLPQYLSYLVTGQMFSDVTSIGCHTALWDYERNDYHEWVSKEGVIDKLAPITAANAVLPASIEDAKYKVSIGLHDSSAALIPYLMSFKEQFILISTGTWSISLNPFNQSQLTKEELQHDCLNYLQYNGKTVKASRLFSGYEYDEQVKRIASHFNQDHTKYRIIEHDPRKFILNKPYGDDAGGSQDDSIFAGRNLGDFKDDITAYYQLIADIIREQHVSTTYVLKNTAVKRIFVDGGFSKNNVYMHLLSEAFPQLEVFAASMAQATALGTALVIHDKWNTKPVPNDLIELKYYAAAHRL